MKDKIIKVTTPTARKEHICEVCGKKIATGDRYQNISMVIDGKIVSCKRHLKCHNELKVTNKDQFKKEISINTKSLLNIFSFKENMEIAFMPLVINEVVWHFAFKVLELAAQYRIGETVKLSRTVRALREKYVSDCLKDIDRKHFEHIESSTDEFIRFCKTDFTLLYFSANNELKKTHDDLPFLDLRTNAYISLSMIEALAEHNTRVNKMISERFKCDTRLLADFIPKPTQALKDCMEAYISPAEYIRNNHIQTSIKILLKKIRECEFIVS